jgi:hypothetical protein
MAIAELTVQPVIKAGNFLAVASPFSTIISETKNGNEIIEDGKIPASSLNSINYSLIGLTTPAQEAYTSTILQIGAVLNGNNVVTFPFPSGLP